MAILSYFPFLEQLINILVVLNDAYMVGIIAMIITIWAAYTLLRLFVYTKLLASPQIILEIKPLRDTEQSAFSTEQLVTVLHTLSSRGSFLERLLQIPATISLELVSQKESGIRYLVRVPKSFAISVTQALHSFLPGTTIHTTEEYLTQSSLPLAVSELQLSHHFAFPLRTQDKLTQNDPMAYVTGAMTKIKSDELSAYQIVLAPIYKSHTPEILSVQKLLSSNRDLVSGLQSNSRFLAFATQSLSLLLNIVLLPLGLLIFMFTSGREGPLLNNQRSTRKATETNPYQQELEKLVKNKIDQPLFRCSIRVLARTHKNPRSQVSRLVSTVQSMSSTQYQSLRSLSKLSHSILSGMHLTFFRYRALLPFSISILSTSEIGDLYHLPYTSTTKTEDIVKQHSRELPAPLSLKRGTDLDVCFAKNTYGNSTTNIGLTLDERRRHMYILGATGTGKSTMLLTMIAQDIANGKGLAVVDPHGDLIEQILHTIPEERIGDVVYFNPDDIAYPIGINLLELTPDLPEEEALREREYIAESIISLFHKIYSDKYSGPRMEYILRNTIHTAFTVKGATLFTIYKLLINNGYRKAVVRKLTDENLLDFWKHEFAKAGDYQKVKMISPITNKIGRFLFSPTAKRILEQEKSTINFDEIINEGKILLCNLSKGKLGEDNSEVLGVLIMAKLQLAALKRARMREGERKDFYLYVDEFQNFATPAFAQILSEARKYRLCAVLAHQTTSQMENISLVHTTLANTGTVVCFRTANPEDEKLILPQFRPYIEQGEIASLPSYHFYMRLGALNPEEPFSGMTLPINSVKDELKIRCVIESSRENYATKYVEPEQQEIKQHQSQAKETKSYKTEDLLP